MSLQIQGRSDHAPPARLRPLAGSFVRRLPPLTFQEEIIETESGMRPGTLPVLATANDAREVVRFLRKRPNGVTTVEWMNAEPKRIFDARKVAAYEFWGIVQRENERLTLTQLGQSLADALEPECRLHRDILHRVPAYHAAIRNIYDEGLDIATHPDVLRCWSELRSTALLESDNAQDMEAAVVCFFSLCHAAELGTATVGKRGQPARLRVDMEQVARFLSEEADPAAAVPAVRKRETPSRFSFAGNAITKVLISTGGIGRSVDHLDSLLSLAGFESRAIDCSYLDNGLLPNDELSEMQQCQAGIFVIGPNNCTKRKDGTYSLRHEWITKISVAAALFDWRIVVFWNGKLPPPDEVSSCGIRLVSSEDLDWEACLGMVSHLKELTLPLSE